MSQRTDAALPLIVSTLLDALVESGADELRVTPGTAPTLTFFGGQGEEATSTPLDREPVDVEEFTLIATPLFRLDSRRDAILAIAFFDHLTSDHGVQNFEVVVGLDPATLIVRPSTPDRRPIS